MAVEIKNLRIKPYKISKPVICIGNFIAGGSGKTPVAIAVGKLLQKLVAQNNNSDFKFSYLSSGYKGGGEKFQRVVQEKHSAKKVGDEPLILSEVATTFVAKKRLFGAQEIDKIKEIKAIILDDGMQNNSLRKDLTIAVIDGNVGFGNGFLIPAGPMRDVFETDLAKIDFAVVVGDAKEEVIAKLKDKKIVHARLTANNLQEFMNCKLIAFCGLAYPEKFFSFVEKQGANIVQRISFSDHYAYSDSDLRKLLKLAENKKAQLVTTKKDWIKFSQDFKEKISYLDVELKFADEDFVMAELKRVIGL